MGRYSATVHWDRRNDSFIDNKYSRRHRWIFDSGIEIPASASPQVVPEPYADSSAVDPEEAFVAALSSCHMLWFLSLAAQKGFVVDTYADEAVGMMAQNKEGNTAMTEISLRPNILFRDGAAPDQKTFKELHHQAHEKCFLANSVLTNISIEATFKLTET